MSAPSSRFCLIVLLLGALLSGCQSDQAFRDAKSLIAAGQVEEGMARLDKLLAAEPANAEYRTNRVQQQELRVSRLLVKAQTALINDDFDAAEAAFAAVLQVERQNPRALTGIRLVDDGRRFQGLVKTAENRMQREPEEALTLLRAVLAESPTHAGALRLKRQIESDRQMALLTPPQLSPAFKKPVTLQFREAALSEVFQALAQVSGLSFIFDKDVTTTSKVTLYANNMTVEEALGILLTTSQLEKKVLGESALLIYPNNPAKKADYQENIVKSFYIGNADPKQTMNLIKTMVKTRDVFIDEKVGMLTVRDTTDNIRMIEKLVAAQDLLEPEVMLEVEVLEVVTSKLQSLGIRYPDQLTLSPFSNNTALLGATPTTPYLRGTTTLRELTHLNASRLLTTVSDPGLILNLKATDGLTNLLANPRIRVKSREKAKIRIGDKVPVITTTTASTGVTSESVQYLDVGLALDVDPQVHPDGQVSMKMALEVSNVVKEVTSKSGLLTYQIGNRRAETVLRLKDGETQVLAGLIKRDERVSGARVPGLGTLPVVGRLFGSQDDSVDKTEIVLLVTPRVLRRADQPPVHVTEFSAGSDNYSTVTPLRLSPAARVSMTATAGAVAPPPMPQGGGINPANGMPMTPVNDPNIIVTFTLDAPPQVAVGKTVELKIASQFKQEVKLVNLEVVYDHGKVEFEGAAAGPLMGSSGGTPQMEAKVESPGRLRLIVQSPGAVSGSGELATLRFKGKVPGAEPAMVGFGGIFAQNLGGNQVTIVSPDPRPIVVTP